MEEAVVAPRDNLLAGARGRLLGSKSGHSARNLCAAQSGGAHAMSKVMA